MIVEVVMIVLAVVALLVILLALFIEIMIISGEKDQELPDWKKDSGERRE